MANEVVEQKKLKPLQILSNSFETMGDKFEDILPQNVTRKRFEQIVLTAVSSSSQLAEVAMTQDGRKSIIESCLKCASDGLVPDGREAALVKFNQRDGPPLAQYMPMVRGITTRMQQTGTIRDIAVNLVYENEEFIYEETEAGTKFSHKPLLFGDKGKMVAAYACCRTKDGGFYIAALSVDDLNKIQKTSKSNKGPWSGPFKSEMQKKSALKRLAKVAPVSHEVREMLAHDDEQFHTLDAPEPKPMALDKLRDAKRLPEQSIEPVEDAEFEDVAPEPPKKEKSAPAAKSDTQTTLPDIPVYEMPFGDKKQVQHFHGIFKQHIEEAENPGLLWLDYAAQVDFLKNNEPDLFKELADIMEAKS